MHYELLQNKIKSLSELVAFVNTEKSLGRKIVFTNGCFDILHKGHVDYLSKAKDCGNILVVGMNSDASVKMLNKGTTCTLNEALQYEAYCQEIAGGTEDYREGVAAFVEKRKAVFKGK